MSWSPLRVSKSSHRHRAQWLVGTVPARCSAAVGGGTASSGADIPCR